MTLILPKNFTLTESRRSLEFMGRKPWLRDPAIALPTGYYDSQKETGSKLIKGALEGILQANGLIKKRRTC